MTAQARHEMKRAFRHEALFYRGEGEFVSKTVAFLREGIDAGEAVAVAVPEPGLGALRIALGAHARNIVFADMAEVGKNPAQIIPFWRKFCAQEAAHRPARAVGQPVWGERSSEEMSESLLHEALLNVAFPESGALHLVCPYDVAELDQKVVSEGYGCHPYVNDSAGSRKNDRFRGLDEMAKLPDSLLPPPPPEAQEIAFDQRSLSDLRGWVQRRARMARIPEAVVEDIVMVVNELATNSIRYGGGRGVCRLWHSADAIVCEVSDSGHIKDPLVGRREPSKDGSGGRGLWIVNQVSDLVQIRTSDRGTTVRIHRYLDSQKGSQAKATG